MAIVDRRGVSVSATDTAIAGDPNPGLAIKAPCLAATTANITLSGLQTIDGVALAAGNRVLVWQQTDQTANGLYNASTGPWTRTIDARSNDQFASGMQVAVTSGATFVDEKFQLTSADPITLGTTVIAFTSANTPGSRRIDTSAPLAGGGDLTANRTLSISANGITYGLMQQAGASKLLGNATGAGANISEIGLGATLAFSGSALQTAAMTGDVTSAANSFATTIAANAVSNAKMATMAAWTFKVNNNGSAATPTDITIDGLTAKASPAAGDELIIWDVSGAALKKATVSSVSSAGSVSSIAGNTGAFTLSTGITNLANDIRLNVGQLPGETSTGNASAGNIGEYVESVIPVGSKVALVSGAAKTIASITLGAGDWDVSLLGYVLPAATTTTTGAVVSLSGTTNALDLTPGKFNSLFTSSTTFTGSDEIGVAIPPYRLSLSGSTTVFFVAQSNFATSTSAAYGIIRARRAR